MSLLDQPIVPSKDVVRGVVLTVDPNTHSCAVKTYLGQVFYNCNWLLPTNGEERNYTGSAPSVGTHVLLHLSTGTPIILGCLPIAQQGALSDMVSNLSGGAYTPATYPNANPIAPKNTSHAPSLAADAFPGDHIVQTPGGVTMAALQHSLLLRAGAQSQIFVSKLDDIVRVVGRNWERFCDALTDVSVNFRGRGYNFKGAALTVSDQKYNYYNYYEVLGDVTAGETLQEASYSQPASAAPPANNHIQKEVVQSWNNGSATTLATKTWDGTTGTVQWVIGPITFTYASSGWTVEDSSSNASVQLINGSEVYANYGSSSITLNSSQAVLASNGHSVTVDSSGVQIS